MVPANYQEQVLAFREGMRDTYIFGDISKVKENIARLLEISSEVDNILFYQELSAVLGAVATAPGGQTWIDEEGRFGLGLLKGTITHSYEAKFIGVRAREQYRLAKIQDLEEELSLCAEKFEETQQQLLNNKNQIARLETEYGKYPSEFDVRESIKDLYETLERLNKLEEELAEKEINVALLQKELTEAGLAVAENSKKLYLKGELSIYREAKEEASAYYDSIGSLELLHQSYLHSLENVRVLQDRMEEILLLLDEIRYDIGKKHREVSGFNSTISACDEQLKAKDYESVREQLEHCIKRLAAIPEELKDCYLKQSGYEKDYKFGEDRLLALREQKEKRRQDLALLERGLFDEKNLSLVNLLETLSWEIIPEAAASVCRLLKPEVLRNSGELSSLLQQRFYENLSELVDYNLTIQPVFWERRLRGSTQRYHRA